MRYRVQTATGETIVNDISDAVAYFQGYYNEIAANKSDAKQEIISQIFVAYLLSTGKITLLN